MAAVKITIVGKEFNPMSASPIEGHPVTIIGEAHLTELSVGGGPVIPPSIGPKPPEPPEDGQAKPPPADGGWGYYPEYGWGYFPGESKPGPKQ